MVKPDVWILGLGGSSKESFSNLSSAYFGLEQYYL